MASLRRPSAVVVTRLCLSALVANMTIVLTGALVRLTGSGLGCPTWPKCTNSSYVNTPEYGLHGVIEFGNRSLTLVLSAVVAACIVVTMLQRPRRRDLVGLSWSLFAGIVGQAVLGGITVRTHLNPWTVAAHFLLSMALVAAAATLVVRARERAAPDGSPVPRYVRWLGLSVAPVTAAVLVLGTVVTGSGPHAGDESAARTGFDPATVSHIHAGAVMLLVALTIATVTGLRRSGAPRRVRRAAGVLLGLELAQGAVGYLQYFTGVPVVLVAVHVAGACLVWLAAVTLTLQLRPGPRSMPAGRPPVSVPTEAPSTA
ncbi:MAG: COX15/CtaA family protein [Actinomycetota bacterium]|nr:COX15/CtaA family protein [Actinomycetota bacterium]